MRQNFSSQAEKRAVVLENMYCFNSLCSTADALFCKNVCIFATAALSIKYQKAQTYNFYLSDNRTVLSATYHNYIFTLLGQYLFCNICFIDIYVCNYTEMDSNISQECQEHEAGGSEVSSFFHCCCGS